MYMHTYVCVHMYSTCMYVHTYIVTFADTYMSGYCLLLLLSTAKLNLKLLNKIQSSEQPKNKYQHQMAQLSTEKHHSTRLSTIIKEKNYLTSISTGGYYMIPGDDETPYTIELSQVAIHANIFADVPQDLHIIFNFIEN